MGHLLVYLGQDDSGGRDRSLHAVGNDSEAVLASGCSVSENEVRTKHVTRLKAMRSRTNSFVSGSGSAVPWPQVTVSPGWIYERRSIKGVASCRRLRAWFRLFEQRAPT